MKFLSDMFSITNNLIDPYEDTEQLKNRRDLVDTMAPSILLMHPEQGSNIMTEDLSHKILSLLTDRFHWDTGVSLEQGENITDRIQIFISITFEDP